MFGTQESVLITHTLETVIDRLAKQKRAKIAKAQQVSWRQREREGETEREHPEQTEEGKN